jgi:hypothetical protein
MHVVLKHNIQCTPRGDPVIIISLHNFVKEDTYQQLKGPRNTHTPLILKGQARDIDNTSLIPICPGKSLTHLSFFGVLLSS